MKLKVGSDCVEPKYKKVWTEYLNLEVESFWKFSRFVLQLWVKYPVYTFLYSISLQLDPAFS